MPRLLVTHVKTNSTVFFILEKADYNTIKMCCVVLSHVIFSLLHVCGLGCLIETGKVKAQFISIKYKNVVNINISVNEIISL